MPALNFKRVKLYRPILCVEGSSREIDMQTMSATSYSSTSGGNYLMNAVTPNGVYLIKANASATYFYNNYNMTTPIYTAAIGASYSIKISPDGQKIAYSGSTTRIYNLNPAFASTPSIPTEISNSGVTGYYSTYGGVFTPDSTKYIALRNDTHAFYVVNVSNWALVTSVAVSSPFDACINSAATKAYVTSTGYTGVQIVDLNLSSTPATATRTKLISTGSTTRGIAITPDGKKVLFANYDTSTISVLDTATETITATISVTGAFGANPYGVSISPDGKYALIALAAGNGGGAIIDIQAGSVKNYISTSGAGMFGANWITR